VLKDRLEIPNFYRPKYNLRHADGPPGSGTSGAAWREHGEALLVRAAPFSMIFSAVLR
jgi:hypothetical protein